MKGQRPLIFNIHRLAMDDGPGLRSTVFLKGCPLACDWCHNPESMRPGPEVAFFPRLCIGCGACRQACPEGAIAPEGEERLLRSRCTGCGLCADACPAAALRRAGNHYPVQELVALLLRDRIYYRVSGGGVTFSGGEPTLHLDYLTEALSALAREGIHTALQTCGHFQAEPFIERLLPLLDLIFFDLKLCDTEAHRRFTGRENRLIHDTFRRLTSKAREKIVPRIPLVPGRTATRANLLALANFLKAQGFRRCELLPYNPGGGEKRRAIGLAPPADLPGTFMDQEEEKSLREFFFRALAGHGADPRKKSFPRAGSSAGSSRRNLSTTKEGEEPCRSISTML
ncbi:glycyl-radical enzyme activating protein [Thiovibrio sp. JS02]